MMGKLTAEPKEPEEGTDTEPLAAGNQQEDHPVETEEEEVMEEEEVLLRDFEERRKLRKSEEMNTDVAQVEMAVEREENVNESEPSGVVEISDDEEDVSEFNGLFQKLVQKDEEPVVDEGTGERAKEEEYGEKAFLEEGPVRLRTMEDMDLLSQSAFTEPGEAPAPDTVTPGPEEAAATAPHVDKKKKRKLIDRNEVLSKEAKVIQVPMAPTVTEEEEEEDSTLLLLNLVMLLFRNEDEQKMIIKEAFAGDDVISDFLKDKRRQEEMGKPKVVDLTLPGWGEWGGIGLKPSRNKRRRFRVKVQPPPPRRDQDLPSVIISEKRNPIALQQVNQLPFPFENPAQFESSIRTPIGSTWNTQRTVQKLTAPKVITQMGAIIEPISQEDFIKGKTQATTGKEPDICLSKDNGQGPKRSSKDSKKKGNPKRSQLKKRKNKP
ncbi:hypothetical protein AGOR_G00018290 [Albula goreensis]|uniref:Uncharacterized protein n=1 Tax=Albula goreensis TaxID=1534307 RepID=A0A8T3E0B0_9TELE|nr:hypothetical protein AGOR_G00018290 [Albula goreensis]